MKRVRVLKFGGTSVANAECLRQVAALVAREVAEQEYFPVVVVSALAGVTDRLFELASDAGLGKSCARGLAELQQRHLIAAEYSALASLARPSLLADLAVAFELLEQDLARVAQAGEWALATVSAWGERLSALLLTAALQAAGVNAEAVREEVIVTEAPANFRAAVGAEPLASETGQRVRAALVPRITRRIIPVVPGFIARSSTGKQTLLGRGGSDRTATLVAAALDQCVEVCIYTDVGGVLSADPRLVKDARRLPQLSYSEAARLAWFGAKVLHPQTLGPIMPRGIPVYVKNTFDPGGPGTLIGPYPMLRGEMGAFALRRRLALVTVRGSNLLGSMECVAAAARILSEAGSVPVATCASHGNQLAFVVEEGLAEAVVARLRDGLEDAQLACRSGLAACTYITGDLRADLIRPGYALTLLAAEGVCVEAVSLMDSSLTLLVCEEDAERTLRELHAALIPAQEGVAAYA